MDTTTPRTPFAPGATVYVAFGSTRPYTVVVDTGTHVHVRPYGRMVPAQVREAGAVHATRDGAYAYMQRILGKS